MHASLHLLVLFFVMYVYLRSSKVKRMWAGTLCTRHSDCSSIERRLNEDCISSEYGTQHMPFVDRRLVDNELSSQSSLWPPLRAASHKLSLFLL